MKKVLFALAISAIFVACDSKKKDPAPTPVPVVDTPVKVVVDTPVKVVVDTPRKTVDTPAKAEKK